MFGIYILIFWIFLALLEIEIEGKNGWAENLPTWRKINTKSPIGFFRNLTGYHLILGLMILCLNHIVFVGFFGFIGFSDELFILAFHLFLLIYWDFLWFILNPHFTTKKFKKEHILWYTDSRWIMWFPIDYWYGLSGSLALGVMGLLLESNAIIFSEYAMTVILWIFIWLATFFASPFYHRWYNFMRK